MKKILCKLVSPFVRLFKFVKSLCTIKGRLNRKAHIFNTIKLLLLVFASLCVCAFLVSAATALIPALALLVAMSENITGFVVIALFLPLFIYFIVLFVFSFVASIAVTWRRFHDMNLSGWWYLAFLVYGLVVDILLELPTISETLDIIIISAGLLNIVLIILVFTKRGTKGENRYGDDLVALVESEEETKA